MNRSPEVLAAIETLRSEGLSLAEVSEVARPHMNLRDWFAGQALVGMMAIPAKFQWKAQEAYAIADAMLAARGGK